MQENVGKIDRAVRLVAGSLLVAISLSVLGGLLSVVPGSQDLLMGTGAGLVGAVLLVTGLSRTCPINALFGIDTRGGDVTGRSRATGRRSNGDSGGS